MGKAKGGTGKVPKQRRRKLDPEEARIHKLLENLAPLELQEVVDSGYIAHIWSGCGTIYDVTVRLASGTEAQWVVKLVDISSASDDDKRVSRSYLVECNFYERGYAARLMERDARCPQVILATCSGDSSRYSVLCMTKLDGLSTHTLTPLQAEAALTWLANMHAAFWGAAADEAVTQGDLHDQGCFWNLDARASELENMPPSGWQARLRLAARAIDARLKRDPCQTLVHGDAKAENMLFQGCAADGLRVAFCDFQYVGKSHPGKDLVWCLLCLERNNMVETRSTLLRFYVAVLQRLLEARGIQPPSYQQFQAAFDLCLCDLARWLSGWGWLGFESIVREYCVPTLDLIDGGSALESEAEYSDAVFKAFPLTDES